jgi:hypothetical protein
LAAIEEDEIQYGINFSALPNGVYDLHVQASAKIIGGSTTLFSNILTHKITKFVEGSHEAFIMVYIPEKIE